MANKRSSSYFGRCPARQTGFGDFARVSEGTNEETRVVCLPLIFTLYLASSSFCHSSHVKTKNDALKPDQVEKAEKQAHDYFSELLSIRKTHGADSVWLFGPDVGPTILDAHTVPFILRMMDEKVGRSSMVPTELQEYASRVMGGPEWDAVMHGRPTMYDASMGPVRELNPLW